MTKRSEEDKVRAIARIIARAVATVQANRKNQSERKLFAFTFADEIAIEKAKESAMEFMEDYGKGTPPRQPGMYYRDGENPDLIRNPLMII